MADEGPEMNGVVLVGTEEIDQESLINTNDTVEQTDDSNGDDLLQLALDEASGGLTNNTIAYTVSNELVDAVSNEAFQGAISGETTDLSFENATYVVSSDQLNFRTEEQSSQYEIQTNESQNGNMTVKFQSTQHDNNASVIGTTSSGMTVTLVPANAGSGAPLGSSQNPIRIIQQGNQYTPVQQLTTDQLQQIMQVVQQQQVAKSTSEGGGSSVLYNPQTNTKIVYRVIYPSELHKTSSGTQNSQGQQTAIQLGQFQKRTYRKKLKEEEERLDGPELTREEKEAKKKHAPRTRSGRVSKPPKHMMKDYKHIHVVDWDEDYDDSDGGYSDFKYSEDEREEEKDAESEFMFDTGQVRPKNWKCSTCHKSYIGRGGLGRHYRLNPTHGDADDLPQEESDSSVISKSVQNGMNYTGSISEDSNTQDSVTGMPYSVQYIYRGGNRPRRRGQRGRPSMYDHTPAKKRHRLKEFIKQYDTEDLMDIVLPRLAKVVTLWEFLMMKVESSNTNKPNMQSIYQEFETLTEKVKELFKKCLKLSENNADSTLHNINSRSENKVKMSNSRLAEVIDFQTGTYEVNSAVLQSAFQDFALNDMDKTIVTKPELLKQKRPVEIITGSSVESPTKRFKSLLSNEKKTNIVVSTQGNIVLMGTPQTTSATTSRVVLVNSAQTPQTSPLIVLNKNQSNASAAVLECDQSQPSSILYSVNQSQTSTGIQNNQSGNTIINQTSLITNTPTVSSSKVQAVPSNVVLNQSVSTKQQSIINNKTAILPQNNSSPAKTQTVITPSKQTSIHNKPNVIKSPGIAIHSAPGFNSVGTINSVYNTSLLTNNQVQKPKEVVSSSGVLSNSISLLPSVVSTGNVIITENGTNNIVDENMIGSTTEQGAIQMKIDPTSVDGSTFIISSFNGIDQNGSSEPINVTNTDVKIENTATVQPSVENKFMETNSMETGEIIQFVDDQMAPVDQVNSSDHVISASNIYQTPEGIIIIQNPDGSTVQLQGSDGEPIPLETVQALLEGQYLQTGEDGIILNQ